MAATGFGLARFDHIVVTVRDLAASLRFYTEALGMTAEEFTPGRWAVMFGPHKINLHEAAKVAAQVAAGDVRMLAREPRAGGADFCLITRDPPEAVIAHLTRCGVAIEEGPVARSGALGPIRSVYCRDPDGSLVEIASYPPGSAGAAVG